MAIDPLAKHDNKKREKATIKVTFLSMLINVVIAAGKIICGVIFGAISLVSDGFNNLSDCGTNIINIVAIGVSDKPADKEHPYGHARSEYVATLILSFIIIFVGLELFTLSIERIIEGEKSEFSIISVIMLCLGILAKLTMFILNRVEGKKHSSELLNATSVDSLCDIFASVAVLISLIIGKFTSFNPDGYAGALVAVIIFISGIRVLKRTSSELVGKSPSKETIDEIKRRLLSYEGIYGIHGLEVHNYVNKMYAIVHAEIDANIPVLAAHELIDKIENDFSKNTDVSLTIHLDPVILHDAETNRLSSTIDRMLKSIDKTFSLHDLRVIKCNTGTKLIFEVCVPCATNLSDDEILGSVYELLYDEFGLNFTYLVDIRRELT